MHDILSRQRAVANHEFASYNFGERGIASFSGWEYTAPGDIWTRPVFFLRSTEEMTEDNTTDTLLGVFTVIFSSTKGDVVSDACASIGGTQFGSR